jgi:hypothetical protein
MGAALRRLLLLVVLMSAVAGCGGGSSGSTGPSFNLTGTWVGAEHLTVGNRSANISLQVSITQSGNSVGGGYVSGAGDAGSFVGTVSGTQFSGTLTSSRGAGTCNGSGDITSGGNTITGTLNCSTGAFGTFALNRS